MAVQLYRFGKEEKASAAAAKKQKGRLAKVDPDGHDEFVQEAYRMCNVELLQRQHHQSLQCQRLRLCQCQSRLGG